MTIIRIVIAFLLICLSVGISALSWNIFQDHALSTAINIVSGGVLGWYFIQICDYIERKLK